MLNISEQSNNETSNGFSQSEQSNNQINQRFRQMNEWKEYKLREVAEIKYGKAHHALADGNIPTYGSGGLMRYVEKPLYEEESILIPRKGSLNNILYKDEPFWTVDTMFYTKLDKKIIYPKFLFYQLTTVDFANMNVGSAVPSMTVEILNDLDILLPPLPTQTAIAEILSSLDDKIDLLHRQNKTLEQLAETLFRKWFVEDAEESWDNTTLANHTEVFRGLSYKGIGLTDEGNGLPMHNLNSIYEFGGYKNSGIKYYKGEYKDRHLVNFGDIIVTNTEQGHEHRLIGFPGIVPDSFGDKGIFSQHIYKLIPLKETYLTNQFLYYLLMTPKMREQIIGATNGSTVNMLSIDGLQLPEFKLPSKEKVIQFSAMTSDYWKKKNQNSHQIRTLTRLRDTLLPKLMSGEIRLNH